MEAACAFGCNWMSGPVLDDADIPIGTNFFVLTELYLETPWGRTDGREIDFFNVYADDMLRPTSFRWGGCCWGNGYRTGAFVSPGENSGGWFVQALNDSGPGARSPEIISGAFTSVQIPEPGSWLMVAPFFGIEFLRWRATGERGGSRPVKL